jgi:cell division septum initiation protein DivIVA
MQQDATARFQDLGNKLQLLLKFQEQLLRENEKLKQEAAQLREQSEQGQQEIQGLKEQMAILQTAAGNMNEEEKKAFEKRINQYIRDIDKVIAHLNTL